MLLSQKNISGKLISEVVLYGWLVRASLCLDHKQWVNPACCMLEPLWQKAGTVWVQAMTALSHLAWPYGCRRMTCWLTQSLIRSGSAAVHHQLWSLLAGTAGSSDLPHDHTRAQLLLLQSICDLTLIVD